MRDWESLREYAAAGSAAAFERVVREHADLVFTTCLRELRDRHLAEDVTQVVFLVLARNAGRLREGTVLAGWLFRTACFSCRNARRQERRRRAHELKAAAARNPMPDQHRHAPPGADEWDAIQPLLHDGLARLRPADRDAVLLRHFEGKSLKEVGDALGVSSDAAQVRVSRAMVRLREFLGRRGVVVPVVAFATLLRARGVEAAPPATAERVANRVSSGGGGLSDARVDRLTEGVVRAMQVIGLSKVVVLPAVVLAAVAVAVATAVAPAKARREPEAVQLLERFAEGQAKLRSFIIKSEGTARWVDLETETPASQTRAWRGEFRADAKTGRFARRSTWWDERGAAELAPAVGGGEGSRPGAGVAPARTPGVVPAVRTKEQPGHSSGLWDGKRYYTYGDSGPGAPARLTITEPAAGAAPPHGGLERELQFFAGAAAMGYFHADDSRVDVLLSVEGSSVTLRREPEIVRGVQCLVVDGASTSGRYTLWLDPKRGHNLVRAEAEKKQGDVVFGRKLDKGSRVLHVVDVLRIEKVDGEWVPVETEEQVTRVFPQSPTPAQRGHLRHKHTSVQLRPDFDAVRAFEPDDVRDGTLVYSGGKRSVWRSGKLEPLAF